MGTKRVSRLLTRFRLRFYNGMQMKLKICGLQTVQDINYVNQADLDYAGFVFTPHRQQISLETAKMLKNALNPKIKAVGVFVDETYEFIKGIVDAGIIDLVQFHGDKEYEMPCPTIKAFRMQTTADIQPTNCDFALFDSYQPGISGATGGIFDWRLISGYNKKPFFLAGGINITNIRQAMECGPYCIDISSGVEENGRKSLSKIMEAAYECKIW